jgi:hypothetical protein
MCHGRVFSFVQELDSCEQHAMLYNCFYVPLQIVRHVVCKWVYNHPNESNPGSGSCLVIKKDGDGSNC